MIGQISCSYSAPTTGCVATSADDSHTQAATSSTSGFRLPRGGPHSAVAGLQQDNICCKLAAASLQVFAEIVSGQSPKGSSQVPLLATRRQS